MTRIFIWGSLVPRLNLSRRPPMRSWLHSILVCGIVLAATSARADEASYRLVTWSSLSDHTWSPLVQVAYDAEGTRWRHAESTRVLAHAATRPELARLMEESHFAWEAVSGQLALAEPTNRARLVCIYEDSTWAQLGRVAGVRPDGLALQSGRDILVKDTPVARADRVFHEVIHFRLHEAFGSRLPLWLEEGLASWMGVGIARDYYSSLGKRLTGEWPGVPPAELLASDFLLTQPGYVEAPVSAQAFARQSAELVGLLAGRLGRERWAAAVRAMGQGGDWRRTLASGYGVDMTDLKQLVDTAAQKAAQPWIF